MNGATVPATFAALMLAALAWSKRVRRNPTLLAALAVVMAAVAFLWHVFKHWNDLATALAGAALGGAVYVFIMARRIRSGT